MGVGVEPVGKRVQIHSVFGGDFGHVENGVLELVTVLREVFKVFLFALKHFVIDVTVFIVHVFRIFENGGI